MLKDPVGEASTPVEQAEEGAENMANKLDRAPDVVKGDEALQRVKEMFGYDK